MINELYEIFYKRVSLSDFLTDRLAYSMIEEICEDIDNHKDREYILNKIDKFDYLMSSSFRGKFWCSIEYRDMLNKIIDFGKENNKHEK